MKTVDHDLIDLGAASLETRGLAESGSDDTDQGQKSFLGGISTED